MCARDQLSRHAAFAVPRLQVEDVQHPRNERYGDLPEEHLAVPRNSMEIDHILENKNFTREGEPIPVRWCHEQHLFGCSCATVYQRRRLWSNLPA